MQILAQYFVVAPKKIAQKANFFSALFINLYLLAGLQFLVFESR
jgi:hypothetical protein